MNTSRPLWDVLRRDQFQPTPVGNGECSHPYGCCSVVPIGRDRDLQHRGDHPIMAHGAVAVCCLCAESWFMPIAKEWVNAPDCEGKGNLNG
jgi:hypothetical protein